MGVYLAVTLLLFMLVNLRRLMYESVEGVLGGPIGVVFAVFVADVYFEFTRDSCYWSVAVLVVGCYVVEWGSQNRVAIHSDTQCPGLPTDRGGTPITVGLLRAHLVYPSAGLATLLWWTR
ncbi:hypothetical protein F441_09106 [Phytophthora nicotianae CJ01A1]|uniref:Uncharacterized protein n=1 Tax=Phytophthora nicotianae CJ01A1 TaxID=1317063 RepID=W2X0G8_PHYNI|nr:hypothetical protein F441_09106 [Phytophthora nicotianae CJ01A1]